MRNNVRFSSTLFRHSPDVDSGADASQLATWLAERLQADDCTISEPVAEDWGCLLQVQDGSSRFHIGCGHVEASTWLAFIEPVAGWKARLFGGSASAAAHESLCTRLDDALIREPLVSEIEWFSVDRRTGQESDYGAHPLAPA